MIYSCVVLVSREQPLQGSSHLLARYKVQVSPTL